MFGLNVVDHVRLNLTRTGENYTVHARAAERLARLTSRIRIAVLVFGGAAVAASVLSAIAPAPPYRIAAVVAASLAFAAFAIYAACGFEGRVYAHRLSAHRLWLVCERHRALLAEIQDGLLDRAAIVRRRDELVLETHSAYHQTFPLDESAFEGVRQSIDPSERQDRSAPADTEPLVPSSMQTHGDERETKGSIPH
ncbi:MAG: hypothetical protein ACRD2I_14650 [Vicinamibacterales bacterium]